MVGAIDNEYEQALGQVLAKYFDHPDHIFIISSDFCHWGYNFDYFYYQKQYGPIYNSIQKLDEEAIMCIQQQDVQAFQHYLKQTENTICGRHPIAVLLNVFIFFIIFILQIINNSKDKETLKTKFIYYA